MKVTLMKSLVLFCILGAGIKAQASTVISISGPDSVGELISTSRFVSFRWVLDNPRFDVSVFAKLAAVSDSTPFVGTAYITSGPCCLPNVSTGELAHADFTVTSQNSSYLELFHGLTLPSNNYYLTLAGTGPGAGFWVTASPAYLMTTLDSGLAGGDAVASGSSVNSMYPPSSNFCGTCIGQQTQFAVTDLGTSIVPEPSSFVLLAGFFTVFTFRNAIGRKLNFRSN